MVIVDEKGRVIDGDQLIAVFAEVWLRRGSLVGGGVVATAMSNLGLERYLKDLGLGLVRTPVGDRYVTEHMRKHGYNVGGEQSGHIVLSDFSTTGDGLVTALQILAVVARSGKPVSEVCHRFQPLPQILMNVHCRNSGQPLDDATVQQAINQGENYLGKSGRLLIRPSETEPVIRIMAEGEDPQLVNAVVSNIMHALKDAAAA